MKYICKVSMIEIYNETIFDLLSSVQSQCYIREDIKHGVHMEGQVEEQVFSGSKRAMHCRLLFLAKSKKKFALQFWTLLNCCKREVSVGTLGKPK